MRFSLLLAFFLYVIVLLIIGGIASLSSRSNQDFHLGGRRINYWITAISAHASDMSSWLFMAFPFSVYAFGWVRCWVPIGLVLGMAANWHFIAPRLRARSEELNSETIPDFLSKSTQDKSGLIRFISCVFCIFFFLFYIASGLKGIGFLMNHLFGFPLVVGVLLSAFVIMIYITLGGFFAISVVGAFQGLFLLAMILLIPFAMKSATSLSWGKIFSSASHYFSEDPRTTSFFTLDGIALALSWGLGYFGLPHVLIKFMGIDSVKNVKKSKYVGLVWQVLALGTSLAIGVIAKAYFAGELLAEDALFIRIVTEVFSPLLAGFVFCAMLAATISTVDSQIMVSATSVAKDVLRLEGKKSVYATRLSILVITLVAAGIASFGSGSIDELVRYAWDGQGSSFGPLVIASLYFKPVEAKQAAIGMLLGGILSMLWPLSSLPFAAYPMVPAFFFSITYLFIASRRKPS